MSHYMRKSNNSPRRRAFYPGLVIHPVKPPPKKMASTTFTFYQGENEVKVGPGVNSGTYRDLKATAKQKYLYDK